MSHVIPFAKPLITRISDESDTCIIDCLRLDMMHPVVSGNKWFKLKPYLEDCSPGSTVITFGGAWSNHILATAAATKLLGLKSIAIIRGEEPLSWSQTLKDAGDMGMELHFISRDRYRMKHLPDPLAQAVGDGKAILIDEGGRGAKGMQGAAGILDFVKETYDYVIVSVGTGTTLAGLAAAPSQGTKILGIAAIKGSGDLKRDLFTLAPDADFSNIEILPDYHFGGYARASPELFDFMNDWFRKTSIPTDFVYTGKMFFALQDLLKANYFAPHSKILAIHTGGLQGNHSLSNGTLIF